MIKPFTQSSKRKDRGEIAEDGNADKDNGKAKSGVRQIQPAIKPSEGHVNEIDRGHRRHNENSAAEKVPDDPAEKTVHFIKVMIMDERIWCQSSSSDLFRFQTRLSLRHAETMSIVALHTCVNFV